MSVQTYTGTLAQVQQYCRAHYPSKAINQTVEQSTQWCASHGYNLTKATESMFKIPAIDWTLVGLYVGIGVAGYLVGHFGIPVVWSWLKSAWTSIVAGFNKAKAAV